MCYSIPGKVLSVENGRAVVDYFGERKHALAEGIPLSPGDYVYVQAGFVVQKIPEEVALSSFSYWRTAFAELKRIDEEKTRAAKRKRSDARFEAICRRVERGIPLQEPDLVYLLRMKNPDALFSFANELRREKLKNSCCVHGIIEFSNYCTARCAYCGINVGAKIKRYRMEPEEIIERAEYAVNELGFMALVLQSGEDPWYTTEKLVEIVRGIRKRCGVVLFLSIGERDRETYEKLYDAGARGVLLRFETSNPRLYAQLHPGSSFSERLSHLKFMNEIGYLIATGALIGLPGQTITDIARDILLARSLNAEMFSFGPFIPARNTPLADKRAPPLSLVLKTLAAARLASPDAKILVTTALETLDRKGRERGLLSGANSLMINVTPEKHRRLYSIYPNRAGAEGSIKKNIRETVSFLHSLGRAPTDFGVRL